MAGQLASPVSYRLQPQVFQPISPSSYFNRELPVQPAVPVDKAAKAQVFGALVKSLGELPGQLTKEWDAGKKRGIETKVQGKFNDALSGTASATDPQLSDFAVGADGGVALKAEDPNIRAARAEYYRRGGRYGRAAAGAKPTLHEREMASFGLPTESVTEPLPTSPAPGGGSTAAPGQPNARSTRGGYGPLHPPDANSGLEEYAPPQDPNEPPPDIDTLDLSHLQGSVSPEDRERIGQAANYAAGQLSTLSAADLNLTAGNNAAGAPANVKPDMSALMQQSRSAWLKAAMAEKNNDHAGMGTASQAAVAIDDQIRAAGGEPPDIENDPEFKALNPGAGEAAPAATPDPATEKQQMAVGPDGKVIVQKAQPVAGRSVNHISGEIYLRSENGSVKTFDPITKTITLKTPDNRTFQLLPGANQWKEATDKTGAASALIKREAAQMGINTDGMTNGQIADAMASTEKEQGVIRPSRMPVAQSLARLIINHPTLKHYPTIKEAKEAVDAALANPDSGGYSDITLTEGFQRMVNPGATVRQGTIDNMQKAAGWFQQFDPSFQWNRAVQGDKFNPEARKRIQVLADDVFKRSTSNAAPQLKRLGALAKSYGITNPDDFVNNVLYMSPVLGANGEGATPTVATGPQAGTGAAPATPAASADGISTVTTQAQYDALPSGTKYRDSKGVIGKKP